MECDQFLFGIVFRRAISSHGGLIPRLVTPSNKQPDANACRLIRTAKRQPEGIRPWFESSTLCSNTAELPGGANRKKSLFLRIFSGQLVKKVGKMRDFSIFPKNPLAWDPQKRRLLRLLHPKMSLGWSLSNQAQNQFFHRSQGNTGSVSDQIEVRPNRLRNYAS
jgi:hypothetical protein